jgi:hypothetical protein
MYPAVFVQCGANYPRVRVLEHYTISHVEFVVIVVVTRRSSAEIARILQPECTHQIGLIHHQRIALRDEPVALHVGENSRRVRARVLQHDPNEINPPQGASRRTSRLCVREKFSTRCVEFRLKLSHYHEIGAMSLSNRLEATLPDFIGAVLTDAGADVAGIAAKMSVEGINTEGDVLMLYEASLVRDAPDLSCLVWVARGAGSELSFLVAPGRAMRPRRSAQHHCAI